MPLLLSLCFFFLIPLICWINQVCDILDHFYSNIVCWLAVVASPWSYLKCRIWGPIPDLPDQKLQYNMIPRWVVHTLNVRNPAQKCLLFSISLFASLWCHLPVPLFHYFLQMKVIPIPAANSISIVLKLAKLICWFLLLLELAWDPLSAYYILLT